MMREEQWISRAAQGDHSAFTALFNAYEPFVYRIALKFIGNKEDAADIAQDVWTKVYLQLHRFESRSRFSTWLYQATRNRAFDLLRRRRNGAATLARWVDETMEVDRQPETDSQDSAMVIGQLLSHLPGNYQQVVQRCHIQGRPLAEVADSLGISLGTVKSRLYRARLRLREAAERLGVAV